MAPVYHRLADYLRARIEGKLNGVTPVLRSSCPLSSHQHLRLYTVILKETPKPDPSRKVNPLRIQIYDYNLNKIGNPVTINQENHLDDMCVGEQPMSED